jgi:hypothetical protein
VTQALCAAGRALLRRPIASSEITFTRDSTYPSIALSLIIIILVEEIPAHVLLRGHPVAQWVALLIHGYAILWLIGDLRALRESTCRFERTAIAIQLGFRGAARVPFRSIAQMSSGAPGDVPRENEGRLTPGDPPNVFLTLKRPIVMRGLFGTRRRVKVLRLYVDDPAVFLNRLEIATHFALGPVHSHMRQ